MNISDYEYLSSYYPNISYDLRLANIIAHHLRSNLTSNVEDEPLFQVLDNVFFTGTYGTKSQQSVFDDNNDVILNVTDMEKALEKIIMTEKFKSLNKTNNSGRSVGDLSIYMDDMTEMVFLHLYGRFK